MKKSSRLLVALLSIYMAIIFVQRNDRHAAGKSDIGFVEVARIDTGNLVASHLVWSTNSAFIGLVTFNRTIHIWDIENKHQIWSDENRSYLNFAWSPNGERLALGSIEGLTILDASTFQEILNVEYHITVDLLEDIPHLPYVQGLAWSSDGKRLATGGIGGEIKIWDTNTWRETKVIEAGIHEDLTQPPNYPLITRSLVHVLEWSPNDEYLLSSSLVNIASQIEVWDLSHSKRVYLGTAVGTAGWSSDGMLALGDGSAIIVLNETWEVMSRFEGWDGRQIDWSPNGKYLTVFLSDNQEVAVLDAADGTLADTLELGTYVARIQWSPNGSFLATALDNGDLIIWEKVDN